jgi:hypothetical protein
MFAFNESVETSAARGQAMLEMVAIVPLEQEITHGPAEASLKRAGIGC